MGNADEESAASGRDHPRVVPGAAGADRHRGRPCAGVTRKTLSQLLNGHAGISPEMAVRLSKAFGRSPESWLQLQNQYDLGQLNARGDAIQVERYQPST
jgi:hypothetical protein